MSGRTTSSSITTGTAAGVRHPAVRYASVLAIAVCCYTALGAVVRLLPTYLSDGLSAGPLAVGIAVGAPALTGALLRPAGGRMSDRVGPRPVVVAGAVVMAAGVLPAAVPDVPALVGSRLVVGVGEALMMSAAVLWLLRLAGANRRGLALGHIGLANYAGLTLGPLIAQAIGVQHVGAILLLSALLPLVGAGAAALQPAPPPAEASSRPAAGTRELLRHGLRPGVGLMLVNVGYVAVLSFGAAAVHSRPTTAPAAALVVPVFAAVVIGSRSLLGWLPDRLGARTTVLIFAGCEAVGLACLAFAGVLPLAVGALVLLAIGQSLAVPALGLLALSGVPAASQGAAAGLFFAWFDAGVGLGGPAVGAVAGVLDPAAAVAVAGAVVACAIPITGALPRRGRPAGDRSRDARPPPGG